MAKELPRKALIAVSSFNGAIYPGGHKTGVFFVEALHPYEVLTAAGFEVDLASETGTCGFDDKTVTGFTIEGELIFRILDKLRADGVVPVVEAVTAAGAFYSGSVGAFDDYSITSGRVVTGTNPASGRSATERGVKLFDNLELP